LIALNVTTFIWSLADFDRVIRVYGFIPAHPSVLTLLTSMFLHGGLDHIFANMWYLWIFGDNVEDRLGRLRFVILYFSAGLAASFSHTLTNLSSSIPTIGASGAVSGVLGSYLIFFPRERVLTRYGHVPAYTIIGLWFVIQLLFGTVSLAGFTGSNVAFWAHIGGFVFGLIFATAARRERVEKRERGLL
jgi:membrane associated rhomboid family serine protease